MLRVFTQKLEQSKELGSDKIDRQTYRQVASVPNPKEKVTKKYEGLEQRPIE